MTAKFETVSLNPMNEAIDSAFALMSSAPICVAALGLAAALTFGPVINALVQNAIQRHFF